MARVTGADRWIQRVGRLGQTVRTRVGQALAPAAELVAAEALAHLPKTSAADIAVVRDGETAVAVVWAAPEAVPIEFGTSRRATNPVMRPAAEAKREEIVGLVAQGVRRAIAES